MMNYISHDHIWHKFNYLQKQIMEMKIETNTNECVMNEPGMNQMGRLEIFV